MELFSMLAKLTLDASEFEKQLKAAESEADSFDLEEPKLGLDDSEFQQGIEDANDAEVDDLDDPTLGIEDSEFTTGVEDANEAEVEDLDEPKLGLDDTEFTEGLKDAESESESFGSIVGQVFENLKGVLVGTGIVALVGTFVNYLKQGVALAGQNGDVIDKQSQKLHLSAEAYQELNYALGLSGASITDLTRAMRTFDEIQGGKITDDQAAYFEQLGISATDASGKMKSAQELMEETMYALADYTGNDRGLIMEAFFGKNSAGLNALMNSTSDEIKAMRQEAQDLGLVMTDEEVKNAAAYTDATSRLQQAVEGLQTSIGSTLLPLLTDAANELAKIVALFNWRSGDQSLGDQLDEIDKNGVNALKTLEQNEGQAKSLIETLASMGDYWTLDESGKKTFDQLAAELITLYPQLDTVINNNKNAIWENTEAITKNIEEWTKLEQQRILDQTLADKQEAIAQQYASALDKQIEAKVKESEADGKRAEAIRELNDVLQKNEELRSFVEGRFGTSEVTADNAAEIFEATKEFGLPMGTETVEEWNKLQQEASSLRSEADAMSAEADAAMENYKAYAEALASELGITISDTETATAKANELKNAIDSIPDYKRITLVEQRLNSHAIGSEYIPYDNYPALLHRGEKVLTATEARKQSNGTDMSGLEDRIESAIISGMSKSTVRSYLNGNDITDDVDKNMIRKLKARRFAT